MSPPPSPAGSPGRGPAGRRIGFPVGATERHVSVSWFQPGGGFQYGGAGGLGPHRGHRRASEPGTLVAPHGVHQGVCGEGVVGGPRPHILLEAFNDGPVGPAESDKLVKT